MNEKIYVVAKLMCEDKKSSRAIGKLAKVMLKETPLWKYSTIGYRENTCRIQVLIPLDDNDDKELLGQNIDAVREDVMKVAQKAAEDIDELNLTHVNVLLNLDFSI